MASTGQTVADASAAAAGLALGRYFANQGQNSNIPPQLSQLLDLSVGRQTAQNPLFAAVNSGVYQMLPSFAKNPGSGVPDFNPQINPSSYGGGQSSGPSAAGTAAIASLPAIAAILKKLFAPAAGAPGGFVGPQQPTGDYGPATPFGYGGGTGMGPGSNDYNDISNLNASGIGGMFYGGPGGGGGTGYPGDQSGGIPDKQRGPKAF